MSIVELPNEVLLEIFNHVFSDDVPFIRPCFRSCFGSKSVALLRALPTVWTSDTKDLTHLLTKNAEELRLVRELRLQITSTPAQRRQDLVLMSPLRLNIQVGMLAEGLKELYITLPEAEQPATLCCSVEDLWAAVVDQDVEDDVAEQSVDLVNLRVGRKQTPVSKYRISLIRRTTIRAWDVFRSESQDRLVYYNAVRRLVERCLRSHATVLIHHWVLVESKIYGLRCDLMAECVSDSSQGSMVVSPDPDSIQVRENDYPNFRLLQDSIISAVTYEEAEVGV